MSRKHRKQGQRKSFPWPIFIFGGILVLVAVFLFAKQGGGGGGGAPQITVDQQKIDYGYVKFGNDESFKLKVTNTGDGPLRFKAKPYLEVLEGC